MDDSKDRSIGLRISSDPEVTGIEQPRARGARHVTQLPLRLLLVSDLTTQAEPDWPGPSRVISVDKHNFGDMMRQAAPRPEIEVPNRISDTPAVLDIELQFETPTHRMADAPSTKRFVGHRRLAVVEGDTLPRFKAYLRSARRFSCDFSLGFMQAALSPQFNPPQKF